MLLAFQRAHRLTLALTLTVVIICFLVPCHGLVELDPSTLWSAVSHTSDSERDLLVFFFLAPQKRLVDSLSATLTRRMKLEEKGSSTMLGLYDVDLHKWPAGLHVHAHDGAVILFPAGAREPTVYDWEHDPLSVWDERKKNAKVGASGPEDAAASGENAHEREHEHENEHEHAHAIAPSCNGVLRWLKTHSSFPQEIPEVSLSDVWEGREQGLFQAVLSGLEALHKRMTALQAENIRLEAELARLKEEQGKESKSNK